MVLRFLKDAIEDHSDLPVDKFVVTVPASFQLSQRAETVEAAQMAGIELRPGQLLEQSAMSRTQLTYGDKKAIRS